MKPTKASPLNQANYTQMLMQAQEQRHLAQRLINLKPTIDNKQPQKFNHINKAKKSYV